MNNSLLGPILIMIFLVLLNINIKIKDIFDFIQNKEQHCTSEMPFRSPEKLSKPPFFNQGIDTLM